MKPELRWLSPLLFLLLMTAVNHAHPLGNFTISHFLHVVPETDCVRLRYIVDYAEISAFQELQNLDANRDGVHTKAEKDAWLARQLPQWLAGLRLTANGQPLTLQPRQQTLTLLPGAVKLLTMRIECEFEAPFALNDQAPRFMLTDTNHADRQGWHEIVLQPAAGVAVFNSTAYGDGVSDELKAYPENERQAPLAERQAEWSATTGALPAGAKLLLTRAGQPVPSSPPRFVKWLKPLAYGAGLSLLLAGLAWRLRRSFPATVAQRELE